MPWHDCDLEARDAHRNPLGRQRKGRAKVRQLVGAGPCDVVRHRCDEPRCANPDHLVVGTQSENLADAWRKNRLRGSVGRGEQHHHARLTDDDVFAIRALALSGVSQRAIAQQYMIHPSAISRVVNGKRWSHI